MNSRCHSLPAHRPARLRSGFTLVELLTVISVIAILAGILIPTVSNAVSHAKSSKSLAQLNNLCVMSKQYRTEYRIWPTLQNPVPAGEDFALHLKTFGQLFIDVMSAHDPNGQTLNDDEKQYNKRLIPFASFADNDLNQAGNSIVDAFGNDDIVIIMDIDGNGQIKTVNETIAGTEGKELIITQQSPIRSDVVALSPGRGLTTNDVITTWTLRP